MCVKKHSGPKVKKFLQAVQKQGLNVESRKSGAVIIKHWDGVSMYTFHPGISGLMKAITTLNKWEGVEIPMIK